MTFIGRSSSFSKTLINTKGVCKSGDGGWGSYLSHNLTFLQLLVQQPADIKAVTEERRGEERDGGLDEFQMHCFDKRKSASLICNDLEPTSVCLHCQNKKK